MSETLISRDVTGNNSVSKAVVRSVFRNLSSIYDGAFV